MAFRKSSRNQSFTVVFNEVAQHETMSMEARGLLIFMLSLPSDWNYHKKWLQGQCPGWGREKITKVLKELETKGYLFRTPKRSDDGRKLAGWDWEVLAESILTSESRQTRQTDTEVSENSTKPEERVCRHSGNQSFREIAPTNKTSFTKEISKSVNNARATEIFVSTLVDQIMSEFMADNLPKQHHRYAKLKAQEFEQRFPDSGSVADGYSYVHQALHHKLNLIGFAS